MRSNLLTRSKKATAEKNGWWLFFCMVVCVGGFCFFSFSWWCWIRWVEENRPTARRVDSPSATCAEESRRWLLRSAAGGGGLLPSSRRASLRATLPAAASVFFLVSSRLFTDIFARIWACSWMQNYNFWICFCVSFPVILVTSKMTCSLQNYIVTHHHHHLDQSTKIWNCKTKKW